MIAICPFKQLDKIILKDGTVIETNGMILSAQTDGIYSHVGLMIKTTELRKAMKTQEEIDKELQEKGLPHS